MTNDELSKFKNEISSALADDRRYLVIKFPFTGNLMLRMNLIPIRDARVRTACTDGKSIYFDIAFYRSLTPFERRFVLAHEMWHCILMHPVRLQTRIPDLFNIATDMEVNYLLSQQANKNDIVPPNNLLFPPDELAGKSAEVIYEWLLEQNNNDKTNKQIKHNSSISSNDKLSGQFDRHEYETSLDDSQIDDITDEFGKVGFDDDFKPSISKDFAEKMRETIISEVQRIERTQGTIPAGIESFIKELMKPEISWKEVLSQFVTQCYSGKRRWLPPSRRHVYNGIYLQSRRNEKIKVTVAIDTSGSCINDLPKFFSELIGLLNTFGDYDLNLIECDAKVQKYEKYNSKLRPFPISETEISYNGGGGTSFTPVFNYIYDNSIETDCLIFFTDGYGDAPIQSPHYPVLWLLTANSNIDFCSWGRKIRFKSNEC